MDIFVEINVGKYKNALPYARPKEDRAVFDAYQAEVVRLNALFMDDLRAHLGMEPGPAFDALFAHAWEKGHSAGFSEVAIEASDAADLLKAGAAEERAACAELARGGGCSCFALDEAGEFRGAFREFPRDMGGRGIEVKAHDSRCPIAISERIEARGKE
jgi:hypothetical protein